MTPETPPPAPQPPGAPDADEPDADEPEDCETTMTHLELQSFNPEDSAEITREDFREATNLVRQAARKNLKKTRLAFKACEGSGTIRLPRKKL